jgi:cystathionine beta-lyase
MVYTREELVALTDICLENNIMIISDEIHSDLIFEGHKHIPLASISEEVAQNCMISMAPSKTFNVAGLTSSMVIIPNKTKLARYERTIGVGHLGMGNIFGSIALEAAYTHGDEWLGQMLDYLWRNFQLVNDFMKAKLPRVKVMNLEATYLVWMDFTNYGMKNDDLMKFLLENAGVALNDGGRFGTGGDGWLRINIGCPRSMLQEALDKLEKAFG